MYGQSGAGGMGASGGAKQESPEQPQGNPVGMALQVQQLEQQRRMNDAQIALAEAQAKKAGAEATKISGVDTQEALKRIEEAGSRIELNLKEGNYKEALKELTNAEKGATEALKSLREMQEGLTKAQISEAFAIATYYSEKAHSEYWVKENEKIQNQYLKDTYNDRVDAAYYNNAVAIALAAKYESEKEVNEKQVKQLEAEIKELEALADKHNWYRCTRVSRHIFVINWHSEPVSFIVSHRYIVTHYRVKVILIHRWLGCKSTPVAVWGLKAPPSPVCLVTCRPVTIHLLFLYDWQYVPVAVSYTVLGGV